MDRTIHYFQDRTDIWIVRSNISRIGLGMDRTIHYFQDRTDIWIVRSTISRIGLIMDRTIHYFQDRTDIWIVRSNISRIGENRKNKISHNLIFLEIRISGCHRSIRLVKTVCLNQFSDFIIVKNLPKSNFYIKFVEKSPKLA